MVADQDPVTSQWHAMLTGEDRALHDVRRLWRHVPSAPRCKVCASPFQGFGGAVARLFWHGPMRDNPLLCKACFGTLSKHPGGAEVEISVVGAGVHAGEAFVGVVGGDEKIDFTALGDTVNIAARLGGLAGPGELLVSRATWDRAGLGAPPAERELEIAGRTGKLSVVSTGAGLGAVA